MVRDRRSASAGNRRRSGVPKRKKNVRNSRIVSRNRKNTSIGKGRRRRRRGLGLGAKVALTFTSLLLCFVIAAAVYVSSKFEKLQTDELPKQDIAVNDLAEGVGEGYTNFALFGGDSRTGELDLGIRTDSIIIASLNNKTREVKMVSVYRDTLMELTDGSLNKCNSAYSFGGPKGAIDMLNMNLDLEIEDYVTVDFAAITDVIDLLGGIEIDVMEAEIPYINKYVGETAKVAGKKAVKIEESGIQLLDGVQATTYARIRSTKGGDFKRAERQRYVIEKIVEKVLKSNLTTINKIIDAVLPKIKTSLSATEILDYAKTFNRYKLGDNKGFPMDKTTDNLDGIGDTVIPVTLEDNVAKLHEFLYGDEDYQPSSKVELISSKIVRHVGERYAVEEPDWVKPRDMKLNSDETVSEASDTGENTETPAAGNRPTVSAKKE